MSQDMIKLYLCFCLVIVFHGVQIYSQQLTDVRRLIQDKELNYDRNIRPVKDQSKPITTYIGFYLVSIGDVNELQQTITLNALFIMSWIDEQITWNSSDYGSLQTLMVESNRFWTPSILCTTTVEKPAPIGDPWIYIRYLSNGSAIYFPWVILTSSCQLDIRFYPLDRHVCELGFSPWGFLPNEFVLQNITSKVDTSAYVPNGLWNLVDTKTGTTVFPNTYVYYTVTLVFERQPAYVIVNIILPVIFLTLLNLVTFFIPSGSGERLSFTVTLLLAIAVFLTIVSDTLPKTSTSIAILSYSLLTALVFSTCITIVTVYSLRLSQRDKSTPVGGCWQWIVNITRCRQRTKKCHRHDDQPCATKSNKRNQKMSIITHPAQVRSNPFIVQHERPMRWNSHGNIRSLLPRTSNDALFHTSVPVSPKENYEDGDTMNEVEEKESEITWEDVSVTFDMICFAFFCIVLITLITVTTAVICLNEAVLEYDKIV